MSLMRAFGALILLFAVMTGVTSMAHAHAGHVHQSSGLVQSSIFDLGFGSSEATSSDQSGRQSTDRSSTGDQHDVIIKLMSAQTHESGACIPGLCCCQGHSTCTMAGHCCVGALSHGDQAWPPLTAHVRMQLSHQAFHVLDVVFGLDRPPKI